MLPKQKINGVKRGLKNVDSIIKIMKPLSANLIGYLVQTLTKQDNTKDIELMLKEIKGLLKGSKFEAEMYEV